MVEERNNKRRHSIFYLKILNRESEKLTGRLVDITTGGMKIFSEEPVKVNTPYKFQMILPECCEGEKKINFDALSVWCKKDTNPEFYCAGFKLHNLSQSDRGKLETFIRDYTFLH